MIEGEADSARFVRVFVAIALPKEIKDGIAVLQRDLKRVLDAPVVRWTSPSQVHLTLKFLGQVQASALPALEQALREAVSGVKTLRLRAALLGCFPHEHRPRVCWVGVQAEEEALLRLQGHIDLACEPWAPREVKPFHPHLTLARIKPPGLRKEGGWLSDLPEDLRQVDLGEWTVAKVDLMQSELLSQGARHTTLASITLACTPHRP